MNSQLKLPIFDGHNDRLLNQCLPEKTTRLFFKKGDCGHIDIPRASEGGLVGGLFAVFVPPEGETGDFSTHFSGELLKRMMKPVSLDHAKKFADLGIDALKQWETESRGRFKIVTSVPEIKHAIEHDQMASVIHFEGAEPIARDLSNLPGFYAKGLRSMGLVWSRKNNFGTGVTFAFPGSPDDGPGLTNAGIELVQACNRMGIMIDVSHLNEKGFWDVERLSMAPIVATHSCVHAICPIPRNLTDYQLDAIKNSHGLVGINFAVEFIRTDGRRNPDTPLEKMVDHIRYIADRIGVDHVALGSDFDGALISNEIKDAAGLPRLIEALKKSGFDDDDLKKIAYENWFRVLEDTWS